MQRADAVDLWPIRDAGKVETEADVEVFLRQVVPVDQHLADLIAGIGVFLLNRMPITAQTLNWLGSKALASLRIIP